MPSNEKPHRGPASDAVRQSLTVWEHTGEFGLFISPNVASIRIKSLNETWTGINSRTSLRSAKSSKQTPKVLYPVAHWSIGGL